MEEELQQQEDKLKEEIVNLKKQLQYANEELEDWKQRCMRLERELNESGEYMDIDYDREY